MFIHNQLYSSFLWMHRARGLSWKWSAVLRKCSVGISLTMMWWMTTTSTLTTIGFTLLFLRGLAFWLGLGDFRYSVLLWSIWYSIWLCFTVANDVNDDARG